ncbi:DUF3667 domain-containing protein [Halioglobus maricola]|uniref:DUF3667 domain-containing protein n=1 Tax=Halioglobus maricola TaxID=2601894 RepID=A0A5P9NP21_9GAMM|nr:DUF3667 domain-containing protein [Halioglobus maricola]
MDQQTCRNCKTPVDGEYCSHCGQREGHADKRFLDLAGEIVGDVFDVDSRLWRTLTSLLFRPGKLTAEFIAGRRARYIPPLRLYLIFSFVVFLVMAMDASNALVTGEDAEAAGEGGITVALDPNELRDAFDEEAEGGEPMVNIGIADEGSPQWMQDLQSRLEGNTETVVENPNAFVEDMVSYLPQMMFILLPLFALLIWLAYLFSPFHYLQHLVFALHYHCFVYLLYMLDKLQGFAGLDISGWLALWLVAYLPLALRRSYDSGFRGAVGKSLFIYVAYGILLVQAFTGVALIALALL